jgi:hypothetical protein
MTLDASSWGFRRNASMCFVFSSVLIQNKLSHVPDIGDYLTINQLVSEVISTVACGGNILINVGYD